MKPKILAIALLIAATGIAAPPVPPIGFNLQWYDAAAIDSFPLWQMEQVLDGDSLYLDTPAWRVSRISSSGDILLRRPLSRRIARTFRVLALFYRIYDPADGVLECHRVQIAYGYWL